MRLRRKAVCFFAGCCVIAQSFPHQPADNIGCLLPHITQNIKIEELFNNYEGVPYEGIALYKITLDNDAKQDFLKWSILPLSENAELFLTSISDYVELPEIADGYWMLVDRNPGTQKYTNVSFCIYDTAEEVAYMITMDS